MNNITNLPKIILPGQQELRAAVSKLNTKFPGMFKNVKEIRVAPGGAGYGFVNNKEMGVIFIDYAKIKSTVSGRYGAQDPKIIEEAIINSLAETITHEAAHIDDNLEHGEFPAENKARQVMQQLLAACNLFAKYAKHYSS